MTANQLARETSDLVVQLLEADIAIDANTPILRRTGRRALITWPSNAGAKALTDDGLFGTVAEYRRLLHQRQYTCVLSDGSLIQASLQVERDEVVKHRFCYVPCPLLLRSEDVAVEGELAELFDLYLAEEFEDESYFVDHHSGSGTVGDELGDEGAGAEQYSRRESIDEGFLVGGDGSSTVEPQYRLRLRSPLRFDYDRDAQAPGHPGSHLHIGAEDVRWPVAGPISLGHFVRFVFRYFYPQVWEEHAFIRDWPKSFAQRCITQPEQAELFVESTGRCVVP